MGNIGSRIRRQKTRAELLEILVTGIRRKEIDGQFDRQRQRNVKRFIIISSIVLFVILIILNLCSVVSHIVIIVYPVMAILLYVWISRSHAKALKDNHYKLYTMKEEKNKLLEEVKITETYMVAKEILEKYGSSENLLPESNSSNNPDEWTGFNRKYGEKGSMAD